ncbi:MAG: guanosine-3',5'-bis(diphosphate) 3'-pyrophosphohydrolase [Oceanicoccus sp.]|jgi:guanosine-3',5'-bis(diphosphate) 3'-pyrophosphohydrolase
MIEALISSAKTYLVDLDEVRLRHAYKYAKDAHNTQVRKDGTPYITHPVAAAEILTTLKVDEDTLIACLLHDVPEDTEKTIEDVNEEFGATVAFLVEGITKLSKVHYRNQMRARQIESLKKLFLHSAQDPRIILIKLADRLHNMSTLDAIKKPEKQIRIAKETLEIYVPIANLLGVWQLKYPLEDACFRTLNPEAYQAIKTQINASQDKHDDLIVESVEAIKTVLKNHNVPTHSVKGRQKNLYSIYNKIQRTGKNFNQIHDLLGLRIVVDDIQSCYQALGAIHQSFTPKIGRLKDYIAIPKSNGYQSIHTSIFGVDGAITEIQIRTMDMHIENEYGIAAHYFYREEQSSKREQMKKRVQKKYKWVQKILDLQKEIQQNDRFMKHLKLDIFEDRIFVFTPKGDVIDLPIGSSGIDFLYHIHTDLGLVAIDCSINGMNRSLTTPLKSGDVVEINTSEASAGPEVKWLDMAKTNLAKTRIKEYLKEKDKNELMLAAETLLQRKLEFFTDRVHHSLREDEKIYLLEAFALSSWEDLLMEVGKGLIDVHEIMAKLFEYEQNGDIITNNMTSLSFCIEVEDSVGMLGNICNMISRLSVNILKVESLNTQNLNVILKLCVEVENYEQFENLIYNLKKMPGIYQITRENMTANAQD